MEPFNYFNYYTEIEEYFWRKRGAHVLVSPLDWAIVETWQRAGIPLEAVLKGLDRAFENYQRSRRGQAGRPLKTLVYCVDAVLDAAAEAREAAAGAGPEAQERRPADQFSPAELRAYFERNREQLLRAARDAKPELAARLTDAAGRLARRAESLDGEKAGDLEELERAMTVLEERLAAALTADAGEETLEGIRGDLDRSLARYRRKMSAEQLAMFERQYIQKRLFEKYRVPRLSLFYLA